MKNFKQVIIPLLIMLTLSVSIYSCVMVLEVSDNVEKLQEADKSIMEELRSNLNPPDSMPVLTDSLAYYRTEQRYIEVDFEKYYFTVHRFFFKRANYTDSLFSGFSIIVADFDKRGIIIENQDNVTLSSSNVGEIDCNWQTKLNSLTSDKNMYSDFSDKGLRIKTYIRSNKF